MPRNPAELTQPDMVSGLTPFWVSHTGEVTLYHGDVIDVLGRLLERSVHCCITSPPYWGLRAYLEDGHDSKSFEIGSEATPEEFVAKMVEFARGVWRVLRDDGTFWLNLGDSYSGGGSGQNLTAGGSVNGGRKAELGEYGHIKTSRNPRSIGLKAGDLVGIPWRVALALQADGWYLRSDLPWVKPNSMPESCDSRPSKSVENVFLLTKTDDYYFDMQAIRQAIKQSSIERNKYGWNSTQRCQSPNEKRGEDNREAGKLFDEGGRNFRNCDLWYSSVGKNGVVGLEDELLGFDVSVANFKGAHFATFPVRLIEPMILAGTSEFGCCGKCGEPYRRVIEKTSEAVLAEPDVDGRDRSIPSNHNGSTGSLDGIPATKETVGWTVDCNCKAPVVPCVVLDPFNGSGTTCATAIQHGRHGVGIDLSEVYLRECAIPRILEAINGEKKVVGGKKQVLDMKRAYSSSPPTKGPIRKS